MHDAALALCARLNAARTVCGLTGAGNIDAIRLHGDILIDRWIDGCVAATVCATSTAEGGRPPRCGQCGNGLRPGVVWFGERLPPAAVAAAEQAHMVLRGTAATLLPELLAAA